MASGTTFRLKDFLALHGKVGFHGKASWEVGKTSEEQMLAINVAVATCAQYLPLVKAFTDELLER